MSATMTWYNVLVLEEFARHEPDDGSSGRRPERRRRRGK
jgi:hypothetical protein